MSSIVTDQGILHFETIGRGRPVVLLHGWVNSWDVWREAMITLAAGENLRVYALDFWGFGDSSEMVAKGSAPYQISHYVKMVHQFMDNLGINKAPMVGHSMGGTVAIQFTLRYPARVEKVIVVGAPIVGKTLNPFLKLAGKSIVARLIWRFPILRSATIYILLARDSKRVRQMIFRDVKRTTMESFFRSIGDLHKTDLREDLTHLTAPALGIYGRKDNIVAPTNAKYLMDSVDDAQVTMMAHSRHFPMSDEPEKFVKTLTRFLNGISRD